MTSSIGTFSKAFFDVVDGEHASILGDHDAALSSRRSGKTPRPGRHPIDPDKKAGSHTGSIARFSDAPTTRSQTPRIFSVLVPPFSFSIGTGRAGPGGNSHLESSARDRDDAAEPRSGPDPCTSRRQGPGPGRPRVSTRKK